MVNFTPLRNSEAPVPKHHEGIVQSFYIANSLAEDFLAKAISAGCDRCLTTAADRDVRIQGDHSDLTPTTPLRNLRRTDAVVGGLTWNRLRRSNTSIYSKRSRPGRDERLATCRPNPKELANRSQCGLEATARSCSPQVHNQHKMPRLIS